MKLIRILLVSILWLCLFSINARDKEILIKKKIAIIPLFNATKDAQYDYLSTAISDSLRIFISRSGNYLLYETDLMQSRLKQKRIRINSFLWQDTANKIADILEADLVVFGFFQIFNAETIAIHINALDAALRKSIITLEAEGPLDIEANEILHNISEQMAKKIEKELPPYQIKRVKQKELTLIRFSRQGISSSLLDLFQDSLENEIIKKECFKISLRANLESILESLKLDRKPHFTRDDIIKLASIIDTDQIVTGNLSRTGNKLLLNLQLWSAKEGRLILGQSYQYRNENHLLKKTKDLAAQICNPPEPAAPGQQTAAAVKPGSPSFSLFQSKLKTTGFILTVTGSAAVLVGIPLLIYDLTGYTEIVSSYERVNQVTAESYNAYKRRYTTHISLFVSSICLLSLGTVLMAVGIPLMLVKVKKFSLALKLDRQPGLIFCYQF